MHLVFLVRENSKKMKKNEEIQIVIILHLFSHFMNHLAQSFGKPNEVAKTKRF